MESKIDSSIESPRRMVEEMGYKISEETLSFIRDVEDKAYSEGMKMMQEDENLEDISDKIIQRMVRNQEYEIITDIADTWDIDSAIIMHDLVLKPLKTHVQTDQSNSGKK